jgi:hypothetical protein
VIERKKRKTVEIPEGRVERFLAPLVAFIGRGEDERRPTRFKIIDQNGVEREVYAPPPRAYRWP